MNPSRRVLRMQLQVPGDEVLSMPALHWKDDIFLSRAETDLGDDMLLLWGDPFKARLLGDGVYQLDSLITPSCMRHFHAPLGSFVMNGDIRTPQARQEAIQGLGQMFDGLYGTPELRQFLQTRCGTYHYWDFLIVAKFFIHIHQNFADELMRELPSLCPGLQATSLTEIFSGKNTLL